MRAFLGNMSRSRTDRQCFSFNVYDVQEYMRVPFSLYQSLYIYPFPISISLDVGHLFIFHNLKGKKLYPIVISIFIFLITSDIEYLFLNSGISAF